MGTTQTGKAVKMYLYVRDSLANPDTPRRHEVIIGMRADGEKLTTSYELHREKDCKMPMTHGMQFLRSPAFIVCREPNDVELKTRIKPVKQTERAVKPADLPAHQTVADWDDLTTEALLTRAKVLPDSEEFDFDTPREELLAFLVKAHTKKNIGQNKHGDVEELPEDALNEIFGGDRSKDMLRELTA